jgi:hypothetical protein
LKTLYLSIRNLISKQISGKVLRTISQKPVLLQVALLKTSGIKKHPMNYSWQWADFTFNVLAMVMGPRANDLSKLMANKL